MRTYVYCVLVADAADVSLKPPPHCRAEAVQRSDPRRLRLWLQRCLHNKSCGGSWLPRDLGPAVFLVYVPLLLGCFMWRNLGSEFCQSLASRVLPRNSHCSLKIRQIYRATLISALQLATVPAGSLGSTCLRKSLSSAAVRLPRAVGMATPTSASQIQSSKRGAPVLH